MPLKIFSPGLDQYGEGGSAKVKVLVIGGPGAGKTRWSSFFPKPFFADCEGGLASIADRGSAVAAARVRNSDDMLELIKFMEFEARQTGERRKYETLVIDTIDAFQRLVMDEWLRKNPQADSFRGYDAWGYLDGKMSLLTTRLLNLDMNIIVAVHYDEKSVDEGETKIRVVQLQLAGKIKDTLFNDFDLVGWLGAYFVQEAGQRVQKRGLTFHPTYERPFLKDRLHVTPAWMDVTFSENDYDQLFAAISGKLSELPATEDLGVIDIAPEAGTGGGQLLAGGALPEQDPKDVPLEQYDKPTLMTMARAFNPPIEGLKGNTIKSELINMIRARRAEDAQKATSASAEAAKEAQSSPKPEASGNTVPTESDDSAEAPAAASSQPEAPAPAASQALTPEQVAAGATPPAADPAPAPAADPAPAVPEPPVAERKDEFTPDGQAVITEAGLVDKHGAIQEPEVTHDQAVSTAKQGLGAEVLSDRSSVESSSGASPTPATAAPAPATPPTAPSGPAAGPAGTCDQEGCDVDLSRENPDLVRLSFIKFRKKLCNAHYQEAKAAA